MNGKGDKMRRGVNWKRYREGYDEIFGKRNHQGTKIRRVEMPEMMPPYREFNSSPWIGLITP